MEDDEVYYDHHRKSPLSLVCSALSVSYLRQMMITRLLTCPQVSAGTSQSSLAIVSATVVSAAPSLLGH